MSNVFYAWELGANLGHMGSFLPLANLLRERGHTVHWVLSKTHEAAGLLRPNGFSWLQAPTSPDQFPGRSPENYGSILLHYGYAHPQTLMGLVEAWRSLMLLSGADVVVVDHAPTAILAARTLGLPVMNHGNGFTIPPPLHPTPQFRTWQRVRPEVLLANDEAALKSINWVLGELGCPTLTRLADQFDIAEPALLTFPELDHYAQRGPARYWGITPPSSGGAPLWPKASGPKVFAYVRPAGKHYGEVFDALKQLDASVLVVTPGASSELRERVQSPNLGYAEGGVNLRLAAQEAALGVLWGGGGNTALAFLLAGKPVVILPNQIEPYLQGLRVQQMGAGLVADLDNAQEPLFVLLTRALNDPGLRTRAAEFASRYQETAGEPQLQRMVARLEELTVLSLAGKR